LGNNYEKSVQLYKSGYNCCQAVLGTYCKELGLDFNTAMKLSSSFGGGMGSLREVCGAVSGMFMVIGLKCGQSDPSDRVAYAAHKKLIQKLAAQFKEENGSILCRELLGLVPAQFNIASDYKKKSCSQLVGYAAELIDKTFENKKEETL
jgi:C_GCAxxG_C_C family probable redox protein